MLINFRLLVALLVKGPAVTVVAGIDEPRDSGRSSQFPRAPLRPHKPTPQSCNLDVVTRSQDTHLELARATRFLQGLPVMLTVGIEGSGGFEPLLKEDIGLVLFVSGDRRWLQEHEKLMLWKNKGKWERWIALLEIYCLRHLLQSPVGSLLLPQPIASSFLDAMLPFDSQRCVEPIDDPELTTPFYFEPIGSSLTRPSQQSTGTAQAGLGNCPGVLFIPSGPALWQRRELVRNTWLGDYPGLLRPLGVPSAAMEPPAIGCMDYFFLTGWPTTAELRISSMKEKDQHADLIVDCSIQDGVPHEAGLQHKFFRALQVQQQLFPHAEYFVRASDDTYLNVQRMMSLIDFHEPRMLYLGREVRQHKYSKNWSLYNNYLETFDHDRLPATMLGDVVALSQDLIQILIASQGHLQFWAHFDDTLSIWLSTVKGVRRRNALRVDTEWIEFRDILQGVVPCPARLVVAHCPVWKDWQNAVHVLEDARVREYERDEHDAYTEFMMKAFSGGVRTQAGDPCFLEPETYNSLHKTMIGRMVRIHWHVGKRKTNAKVLNGQVDALHGVPSNSFQGYTLGGLPGME